MYISDVNRKLKSGNSVDERLWLWIYNLHFNCMCPNFQWRRALHVAGVMAGTFRSFPHSRLITEFATWRVSLVERELLTLSGAPEFIPGFSRAGFVLLDLKLVFCVVFCISISYLFIYCLSVKVFNLNIHLRFLVRSCCSIFTFSVFCRSDCVSFVFFHFNIVYIVYPFFNYGFFSYPLHA